MKIEGLNKYPLTQEEKKLLEKVNEFEIKLDDKHVIHFKDLLDRVAVCLEGKQDRIKELPLSSDELEKHKQLLDEYIHCKEYKAKADEKLKKRFDDLYEDLKEGEKNKFWAEPCDNPGEWIVGGWVERAKKQKEAIKELLQKNERYSDKTRLKGLFSPSAMEVTLFMENMDLDDKGKRKKEDVVFVYIHEMLHAYYHCCFDVPGWKVREVEECMAEFGALCLLEKLSSDKEFVEVFNHATESVAKKQYTVGDIAAYGFGKYVFDHCANKDTWLLAYSKRSRLLRTEMPIVDEYVRRVYPFYPIKEYECFKCLERILFEEQSCFFFDQSRVICVEDQPRYGFEHYQDFHDVSLRILLIDDKVGGNNNECPCQNPSYEKVTNLHNMVIKQCPSQVNCGDLRCKLCTIKRLMDDSNQKDENGQRDGKNVVFKGVGNFLDYFYWDEKEIECYCCPTVINDFIDDDIDCFEGYNEIVIEEKRNSSCFDISQLIDSVKQWCCSKDKPLEIQCDFQPIRNLVDSTKTRKSIDKVQLVGVRDVRTALLLLSRYKFDMLFVDYLLDNKKGGNSESVREYSIQFFEFLSTDYDKKADEEKDEKKMKKYELLAKLRRAVLDNRGPMDKLWIMPITGFNSPFIQTLQNKNVPLISTRWHIENGADPITTPWQFLVKLNQFIELQLKGCVYNMGQLINFLAYSGASLKRKYPYKRKKLSCAYKPQMPDCSFHDFQAFMGAEFSNFISHFGARPVIRRDAMIEDEKGDVTQKSVFSTYVWNKFYKGDESNKNDKEALFALHNLMQWFYQVAATMPEDRNGVMRLRETFRRLRYYLEIHDLSEQSSKKPGQVKQSELNDALQFIADCIDVLLEENEDVKEGKNKNKK